MIVCVVGAGGREHALCHALARSADVVATPGNPGITGRSPEGHTLESVSTSPEELDADLYVIGPETPLVEGLADRLRAKGKLVFGPGADGARLEGSKAYMKDLVQSAGVPTAEYASFDKAEAAIAYLRNMPAPYVVKTDGLASGKGVLVTQHLGEAEADVIEKLSGRSFGKAGQRIVIEHGLSGIELSFHVLLDGHRAVALPPAQDYKRVGEGDTGPNTGGMGACSPVAGVSSGVLDQTMERIIEPTVAALKRAGIDYRGVLYAGCMLTEEGPKLIEYNVRFGDPETQVVLPRLGSDVTALLAQVASGNLEASPELSALHAVGVVACAKGYPATPSIGDRIHGLDRAGTVEGVTVFHAGTAFRDGELVTAGGRVLCVSALGDSTAEARERAYQAIGAISFSGMHYRHDIAGSAIQDAMETTH